MIFAAKIQAKGGESLNLNKVKLCHPRRDDTASVVGSSTQGLCCQTQTNQITQEAISYLRAIGNQVVVDILTSRL